MENTPREYTREEVRERFLGQIRMFVTDQVTRAYPQQEPEKRRELRERLEGLAHSILCILDGRTNLPAFVVAPAPHPGDQADHQAHSENWYPAAPEVACDIAWEANLHELFYAPRDGALR